MRLSGTVAAQATSKFRQQVEELVDMVADVRREISTAVDKESSHQLKKRRGD
jgi:hypothetical protein